MSSEAKVVKTFYAFITNCKDFSGNNREMCIISRDGKFGLAERLNKKLITLIECKYDYIDSLCCESCYSNVIGVSLGGKWGLYSFKYTVSTKSNRIDCRMVAECEYDFITVNIFSNIVILHKQKEFQKCYYNFHSGKLSSPYEYILFADEHYFECGKKNTVKWIDIRTDSVIYSAEDLCVHPQLLSRDLYLFTNYDFDEVVGDNKSDLVFYNRNLCVSYVIENIDSLNVIKNGYEDFEENMVLVFRKNSKKHIIATNDCEWDYDEIRKIAKEVEYT